jgi:hypothetical protein
MLDLPESSLNVIHPTIAKIKMTAAKISNVRIELAPATQLLMTFIESLVSNPAIAVPPESAAAGAGANPPNWHISVRF